MRIVKCLLVGIVAVSGLGTSAVAPVEARQSVSGTTDPAEVANVAWLLFVDDLHLNFRNTGRLRTLVRNTIKALRGDADARIGLRAPGPSAVALAPIRDRMSQDAAITRLTGHGLRERDILAGTRTGDLYEIGFRAQTTLAALRNAIEGLATSPSAHKHIVFISNGFSLVRPADATAAGARPARQPPVPADDGELAIEIARVADISRKHGVTISTLDPRPFYADAAHDAAFPEPGWPAFLDASRKNLRQLAEATGGTLLEGKSLAEALAPLLARPRR